MLVISSREFRNNQAMYMDLVDIKKPVIIQRGKNKAYKLLPVTEDDYVSHIPEEYLCNPFDVSPSGDMFWADSRHVEELKKAIEQAEKEIKEGNVTSCKTYEESLKLLESL